MTLPHSAEAVYSEPGQCWRMVHENGDAGRPEFCAEPVVWAGYTRRPVASDYWCGAATDIARDSTSRESVRHRKIEGKSPD